MSSIEAVDKRSLEVQRLHALMVKQDWTASRLARTAGLSTSTVTRILNGERRPRPETLRLFESILRRQLVRTTGPRTVAEMQRRLERLERQLDRLTRRMEQLECDAAQAQRMQRSPRVDLRV